jgi:hypothetical protein
VKVVVPPAGSYVAAEGLMAAVCANARGATISSPRVMAVLANFLKKMFMPWESWLSAGF